MNTDATRMSAVTLNDTDAETYELYVAGGKDGTGAYGPFSAAATVPGRPLKRVQVQGGRQGETEAYELYAAG